jgi:hypothetical protein
MLDLEATGNSSLMPASLLLALLVVGVVLAVLLSFPPVFSYGLSAWRDWKTSAAFRSRIKRIRTTCLGVAFVSGLGLLIIWVTGGEIPLHWS